jgi:hypothetical protein
MANGAGRTEPRWFRHVIQSHPFEIFAQLCADLLRPMTCEQDDALDSCVGKLVEQMR